MNRQKIISVHLWLSSFFLPMLFLIPATGALMLLKTSGDTERVVAFEISDTLPDQAEEHEPFFREQFKKNNVDFDFEYIRYSGADFIFRPTSRIHYVAVKSETNSLSMYRVTPNLLKRLTEIHKGHGPAFIKWVEIAFGAALLLITISGLWLALTVPAYRRQTLIAFGVGTVLILVSLF